MNQKIRYRCVKLTVQNDKKRMVTIYEPDDIARQRLLLKQIKPLLLKYRHKNAYGYVEGVSCWDVAQALHMAMASYDHYLMLDIKSFFPSIDRKLLMNRLRDTIDEEMARDVLRYVSCCQSGLAMGSPLSPILSNYFMYPFDEAMSKLENTFYLRYADDMIFFTKERDDIFPLAKSALKKLNLCFNEEKTRKGIPSDGFSHLGFDFSPSGIKISQEKQISFLVRMEMAHESERKAMFQGFQSHFRHVKHLHHDVEMLKWICAYASPWQAALYARGFPNDLWNQAQLAMKQVEFRGKARMKSLASAAMMIII